MEVIMRYPGLQVFVVLVSVVLGLAGITIAAIKLRQKIKAAWYKPIKKERGVIPVYGGAGVLDIEAVVLYYRGGLIKAQLSPDKSRVIGGVRIVVAHANSHGSAVHALGRLEYVVNIAVLDNESTPLEMEKERHGFAKVLV